MNKKNYIKPSLVETNMRSYLGFMQESSPLTFGVQDKDYGIINAKEFDSYDENDADW